ncbi:alpha/beta hydrolase [Kitasatospora sp. NE20-6]|uniref:alpha/beta hydrolase n=1 Tax=Kitasatospora sp. NE20-6 TaxID=2859066 RepID=UPI0034DB93D8
MDRSTALLGRALNGTALIAPRLAGRAAFELFRHPVRRSRVRSTEREVHDRARPSALTVGGSPVTVYRWGDGTRPVLLVHGWRSRASRFAGFVPRLLDLGLSPVAFDAPGHGDSGGRATTILEYREIIARLHARHGPFEAVVAHSFGVSAAFLALREGVPAGRLVAVSGVAEFRFLVDGFRQQLGLADRLERELTRRIERVLFPAEEALWERFDATHRPAEITPRILVVHDQDDDVVPIGQAHRLKAAYGDRLDLLTTRGLGHRRILTEPGVLDNVLGFLAEPSPGRSQVLPASASAAAPHRLPSGPPGLPTA